MTKKLILSSILWISFLGSIYSQQFTQDEIKQIAEKLIERDSYKEQLEIVDSITKVQREEILHLKEVSGIQESQLKDSGEIINTQEQVIKKEKRKNNLLKWLCGILGITTIVGIWI